MDASDTSLCSLGSDVLLCVAVFTQDCFKETNPLPIRRIQTLRMKHLAAVIAEDAELVEKRIRLKHME